MFRRIPSRRALAAAVKIRGRRMERRWPFFPRAEGAALNLGFDDLLELQYARSRDFVVLVVGAYDGMENDPISRFIRTHASRGVLVEPQAAVFERLKNNFRAFPRFELLNAAVDASSGTRPFYSVQCGGSDLPGWTEQLASLSREHLVKHEASAPGLTRHIVEHSIPTMSFEDVLDRYNLKHVDVLQIDAEGMDGQLLAWFPFERLRPGVIHYEIAHLPRREEHLVRERLRRHGYRLFTADSPTDAMAVQI